MQNYVEFNNTVIRQPDAGGLGWDWEGTYTEDTARSYAGIMYLTPQFTVNRLKYSATHLTRAEVAQILSIIVPRKINGIMYNGVFTVHYLHPLFNTWVTEQAYVGQGSIEIGSIEDGGEYYDSLNFNITGIYPISETTGG